MSVHPTIDRTVGKFGVTLAVGTVVFRNWVVDLPELRPGACATVGCGARRAAGKTCCSRCRSKFYVGISPAPKKRKAKRSEKRKSWGSY